MNNFDQHSRNIVEHDRHHYLFGKTLQAINYLTKYYRDDSCSICYPSEERSPQFQTFWAWFITFQPAVAYSHQAVRRFEKFKNFEINQIPDQLLGSFIFSFRYNEEPDDFPTLVNEFLTVYQETDRFNIDPLADEYNSETFVEVPFHIDIDMAHNNDQFDAPLLVDPNEDGDNQPLPQQPIPIQQANPQVHQNNPQNDPMTLLAQQIGNLVLHMQNAPAPQINIPAVNVPVQNRELNLVSYPDFSGGEQDPVTWLEDVEKAFEANQVRDNRKIPVVIPHLKGTAATWWVAARAIRPAIDRWDDPNNGGQSFRPHFIIQFRTSALESKWFAQLTQRKQGPTEDVDSYHVTIEELLRRVESGGHRYPDTAKAQMFINGLRPELSASVSPFMPNTLVAAYERAKAFENSFKQNSLYYNPYLLNSLQIPPVTSPYVISTNASSANVPVTASLPVASSHLNPPKTKTFWLS